LTDRHPHHEATWWPTLVELARRLVDRPFAGDRRELVCRAAEALLGGRASICVSGTEDCASAGARGRLSGSGAPSRSLRPLERAARTRRTELGGGYGDVQYVVASPLVAADTFLGVIQVERDRPFSALDLEMIEALASQAAFAVEAASGRARALKQAWVSTAQVQAARALQVHDGLDGTLATAARLAPMLAGTRRSAVLMLGEDGCTILPRAAYGLTLPQRIGLHLLLTPDEAERLVQALSEPGLREASGGPLAKPLATAGFRSPIALPLRGGDIRGVLVIDSDHDRLYPSADGQTEAEPGWLQISRGIAEQTSTAIAGHELRRSQREEAYVSTALLQVVQATAALTDLDDVLASIARTAPALVGVERCAIYRWIAESGTYHATRAYGMALPVGEGRASECIRPGEYPLLDAVRLEERPAFDLVAAAPVVEDGELGSASEGSERLGLMGTGRQAVRALPLVIRGEFVGALVLVEPVHAYRPGARREEILQGIADQAAIAIQNDRLQAEMSRRERLEQEMALARDIQRSLMPERLPEAPGWQLAATCVPAREVGGDFFDLISLPDECLGLVIADVADKGMPAALFMANARATIRALATHHHSLVAVLEQVNRLLLPDSHRGMFVTAVFASLSLRSGALRYCNAGHNPPLIWRARQGKAESLEIGGTALAVIEEPHLVEHQTAIDPGDWLVLYTDGVTEAFSERTESYHGADRLGAAIAECASGGAEQMLKAIEESVRLFVGETPASDDITLLVLKRDDDRRATMPG
jgi:serine phosphatase RsbU (regulator of sigma subunit)